MRFWLMSLFTVLAIWALLGGGNLTAQSNKSQAPQEPTASSTQKSPEAEGTPVEPKDIDIAKLPRSNSITYQEVWMSALVVLLGIAVLIIEYLLLKKSHPPAGDVLRVFAVTLIIIGALFTITGSFSVKDSTPVIGLMGTVAGYLMGKSSGRPGQEGE